jgi:nicotinamidase/pyrazinamidase
MNKTVFWNVNTQEDFFNDGPMKVPNSESIRPKLRALTEFAKDKKIKVVSVLSWNDPKAKWISTTPDYTNTFPEHCIANSTGTNFIQETLVDGDYFLIKNDAPYIVFPEIHKHRNIILFKNNMSMIEGNKFADSVLNNLGTVMMQRPDYVLYGIGAGLIAKDLAKRGYDVKIVTDATIEFNGLPINYEEIGIGQITTESIFSQELV